MYRTAEYYVWQAMVQRCCNPRSQVYSYYGGRGIRLCDQWRESFAAWLSHIGPRPSPRHSMDRINNDGNYEPGNVRWITMREQASNRRPRRRTTRDDMQVKEHING